MAPSRLEEKLKKLGLATDDTSSGSLSRSTSVNKAKYTFSIYFPLPPFDGIQFNALKCGTSGYNFTGLLLGVGGRQLQRIKQESHARVEVVNASGNLNGAHPDPLDPELHALIIADCVAKLQKAAHLIWEVLSPLNAKFEPIQAVPGGSVRLRVIPLSKSAVKGKTDAQQKVAKHAKSVAKAASSLSVSSSHSRLSLDAGTSIHSSSSSSSSSSSRGLPPSPAMTPLTPAAAGSQQGPAFVSHKSTGSHGSSRSPMPRLSISSCNSPLGVVTDPHSEMSGSSGSSGMSNSNSKQSNSNISSLEDFALPPAAMPPTPTTPLAMDWPALPSAASTSQTDCTLATEARQAASDPSSSASNLTAACSRGVVSHSNSSTAASSEHHGQGQQLEHQALAAGTAGKQQLAREHQHQQQQQQVLPPGDGLEHSQHAAVAEAVHSSLPPTTHACMHAGPSQQQAGHHSGGSANHECDALPDAALAPITPQLQQGDCSSCHEGCSSLCSSTDINSYCFQYGLGICGSTGGGSNCGREDFVSSGRRKDTAQLHAVVTERHMYCHDQQQQQQQQSDMELLVLRQRAGLVSQACLLNGGPGSMACCHGLLPEPTSPLLGRSFDQQAGLEMRCGIMRQSLPGACTGQLCSVSPSAAAAAAAGRYGVCDSHMLASPLSASPADPVNLAFLKHQQLLMLQQHQQQQSVPVLAASGSLVGQDSGSMMHAEGLMPVTNGIAGSSVLGMSSSRASRGPSSWDAAQVPSDQFSAQTAAVAAAVTSAFGVPSSLNAASSSMAGGTTMCAGQQGLHVEQHIGPIGSAGAFRITGSIW